MFNSITVSFTLGEIFGLSFLLYGIALTTRIDFFRGLIQQLDPKSPALMAHAMLCVVLGLFLVDIHAIWKLDGRVVVTLICWAFLTKSILWLFASEKMVPIIQRIFAGVGYYYVTAVCLLVGTIILSSDFFRAIHRGLTI